MIDFIVSVSPEKRLSSNVYKTLKNCYVCTNWNDQILHLNMDLNVSVIQRGNYISKLADCKCSMY